MTLSRTMRLSTLALITFVLSDVIEIRPQALTSSELPLTIEPTNPATNGDSREPDLSRADDGQIILRWVEKVGEKRYALCLSLRDKNGWSEPSTVAQGENWFVNWADFPSAIMLRDGSMAAHWLVKSGKGTVRSWL